MQQNGIKAACCSEQSRRLFSQLQIKHLCGSGSNGTVKKFFHILTGEGKVMLHFLELRTR